MTLPGQTNGVALFFDPVAADLGLTRVQVALAYTLGTLAGALPAPLVGRWIDRRFTRRVLAAAAVVTALLSLAVSAACADALEAGAASAPFGVPPGTPLAGYGSMARRLVFPDILDRHNGAFWFKPHTGELDTLMTRALVLESPGVQLIWVTMDIVAVDRAFTDRLASRLRLHDAPSTTLIVSASHTHSGPGAFVDSAVMGFVATDRLEPAVRDALLDAAVRVVDRALATKRPARTGVANVMLPSAIKGRLGRAVDPHMVILRIITNDGSPIALVWNYAIHGTMLGPRNVRLSGDVMGTASQLMEAQLGAPVLFVNGAVADVSPRRHGRSGMAAIAQDLAATIRTGWSEAQSGPRAALRIKTRTVHLPAPHLSLRNCLGRLMPRGLTLRLGSVFPQEARLIGVGLGPVTWVAIPGELQSSLGQTVKRAAGTGQGHAFIAGLSNDYLGYFVTARDYFTPSYVACANLYGPSAGDDLARAAAEIVGELAAERGAKK